MRDKRAARENMDRALREQAETEALLKKADDTVKKKESEADKSYSEAYNNSNIVRRERTLKEFNSFKQNVKSTLLENLFTGLFNDSLGNTKLTLSEDTKVFNRSLIMSFIKEEGVDDILKRMSTTSRFTSEMANIIKEKSDEIIDNVDPEDPDTFTADSEEQINFYDNIDNKDDIHDLTDIIKMRVSRATEDFVEKNIMDSSDIKDLMNTTKEKITNIKTGDPETDEAIAQEATIKMKRAIKETTRRPHSIYEQMVINLTEQILKEGQLKEKFTTNEGRLDMDSILERVNSYYTLFEMINTLKLKTMDENYIMSVVSME